MLSATLSQVATFPVYSATVDPNQDGGTFAVDAAGNIFGTAGGDSGYGVVFELPANGSQIETIAKFAGLATDSEPSGLVMDSSGNLYGETYGYDATNVNGTTNTVNDGTIFEVAAGSNTITTLFNFNGSNGANPEGGLTIDSDGNLFGTCSSGGMYGYGTVFELPSGSDTIQTLYAFPGNANNYDNGTYPESGVVEDAAGNLYGTTTNSGPNSVGDGSVFKIASGTNDFSLIAGSYNGLVPAALTPDGKGDFFGVNGNSVVEIPTTGAATAVATISGDAQISGPLVLDSSGDLFGEDEEGGLYGGGYVFEIAAGSGTVTDLGDFGSLSDDVGFVAPQGGLVLKNNGTLYGATSDKYGGGDMFSLTPGSIGTQSLVLSAPGAQTADAGIVQTFYPGSFTSTEQLASYTATINWGDQSAASTETVSTEGQIPNVLHTYASGGSYTASVTVSDSAGDTSNTVTFQVEVKGSNGGTTTQSGALSASITQSTLPTAEITGVKQKGTVVVELTNTGSTLSKGKDAVSLYASTDGSIDSSSVLVETLTKSLSIKPLKTVKLPFSVRNMELPAGSYALIAQVTDASGDVDDSPTFSTINVAAAYVSLTGTFGAIAPATVKAGKTASLVLTLTNSGNIAATGVAQIAIGLSTDGTNVSVPVSTINRALTVKPGGKPTLLRLKFKLPEDLQAMSYDPIVTVTQGADSLVVVGQPFTSAAG